jgi:ligand-binding sensor domain-containing protein
MPTLNCNPTVQSPTDSEAQGGATKNVTSTKQNSEQVLWLQSKSLLRYSNKQGLLKKMYTQFNERKIYVVC